MVYEEISIHTDYIQLDQFLKWAGLSATGGQAKEWLAEGIIFVNGSRVTEKRKKIRPGDTVRITDIGEWHVVQGTEDHEG